MHRGGSRPATADLKRHLRVAAGFLGIVQQAAEIVKLLAADFEEELAVCLDRYVKIVSQRFHGHLGNGNGAEQLTKLAHGAHEAERSLASGLDVNVMLLLYRSTEMLEELVVQVPTSHFRALGGQEPRLCGRGLHLGSNHRRVGGADVHDDHRLRVRILRQGVLGIEAGQQAILQAREANDVQLGNAHGVHEGPERPWPLEDSRTDAQCKLQRAVSQLAPGQALELGQQGSQEGLRTVLLPLDLQRYAGVVVQGLAEAGIVPVLGGLQRGSSLPEQQRQSREGVLQVGADLRHRRFSQEALLASKRDEAGCGMAAQLIAQHLAVAVHQRAGAGSDVDAHNGLHAGQREEMRAELRRAPRTCSWQEEADVDVLEYQRLG
eukprot:scaffold7381_cov310-Pinguiococcus_pyrenoidosus.AAC.99